MCFSTNSYHLEVGDSNTYPGQTECVEIRRVNNFLIYNVEGLVMNYVVYHHP